MTAYTMRTQIKLSPEALQKMKDASISGAENMALNVFFELDQIRMRLDETIDRVRSIAARANENADRVNGAIGLFGDPTIAPPAGSGSLARITEQLDWLNEAITAAQNIRYAANMPLSA